MTHHLVVFVVFQFLHLSMAQTAESWMWIRDTEMDNYQMGAYLLAERTFSERSTCVLECLVIPHCLSIFMTNNTAQPDLIDCRFHDRFFTNWETLYFGTKVQNVDYYRVSTTCPRELDIQFSRPARMCIRLTTPTMIKDQAAQECASQGGELIILDDQNKIDFIQSVLLSTSAYATKSYHLNASFNGSDYVWSNGQPLSGNLLMNNPGSSPCLYVGLDSTNVLEVQSADCTNEMSVICQLPF